LIEGIFKLSNYMIYQHWKFFVLIRIYGKFYIQVVEKISHVYILSLTIRH